MSGRGAVREATEKLELFPVVEYSFSTRGGSHEQDKPSWWGVENFDTRVQALYVLGYESFLTTPVSP